MLITSIISLVITLLPQILSSTGVISPAIAALIAQLGAALPGLIANLAAGKGPTSDVLAVLSALKSEIAVLRASGTLPANELALADSLDSALASSLTAYGEAQITTDPSTLTELPETL